MPPVGSRGKVPSEGLGGLDPEADDVFVKICHVEPVLVCRPMNDKTNQFNEPPHHVCTYVDAAYYY